MTGALSVGSLNGMMTGGGPQGEWLPNKVANVYIWLAAYRIAGVADAGVLATWIDLSGNGNDFTSPDGNRPIYNLSVVNGQPVVTFESTTPTYMTIASITIAQPRTFFVVSRRTGVTTTFDRVFYTANGEMGYINSANTAYTYAGEASYPTATASDNAFHIITTLQNDDNSTLRIDGAQTTGDVGPGAINAEAAFLGHSGDSKLDGDIAELIIYGAQVSAADIALIENYLSVRYAIALA